MRVHAFVCVHVHACMSLNAHIALARNATDEKKNLQFANTLHNKMNGVFLAIGVGF